ncbi:hypothetical protein BpHYR1_027857 [Brachionus plicatilis]|uniref:Uncharacterized protein n=1 Tax=Brachionus plicatilis TaxID=10195 RepID=A0A3M7SAX7_BRAPC|nr:hypothetical protein BpHYR1_027857 [Brachionus plicatilis]
MSSVLEAANTSSSSLKLSCKSFKNSALKLLSWLKHLVFMRFINELTMSFIVLSDDTSVCVQRALVLNTWKIFDYLIEHVTQQHKLVVELVPFFLDLLNTNAYTSFWFNFCIRASNVLMSSSSLRKNGVFTFKAWIKLDIEKQSSKLSNQRNLKNPYEEIRLNFCLDNEKRILRKNKKPEIDLLN